MNEKELVKNLSVEVEPQNARLLYNTPTFEEYGDIHQLTHGSGLGEELDPGTGVYDEWPL